MKFLHIFLLLATLFVTGFKAQIINPEAEAMSAATVASSPYITDVVLSVFPLAMLHGDETYGIVKESEIAGLYHTFQQTMKTLGVSGRSKYFDCNHFAGLFIAVAQARYAASIENSIGDGNPNLPETLAMAELWYKPDNAVDEGHAIVLIETDKGRIFLEPQTGEYLKLTQSELDSAYLCKW